MSFIYNSENFTYRHSLTKKEMSKNKARNLGNSRHEGHYCEH